MNRLVDVGTSETIIARLRADLAVSQATANRLAREVDESTDRRDCLWEMFKTVTSQYGELRTSIGQPTDERGASSHADAVIHGEWLASIAKERAKLQRAEAFVSRLKRDGVVIPSSAPVRVLDGDDKSERDEPDGYAPCFVGAISPAEDGWKGVTVTPREAWDGDDNAFTRALAQLAGKAVIVREYVADRDEPDRRTRGIDDDQSTLSSAMVVGIMEVGQQVAEERLAAMSNAERADYGTPDQTDGYHGGTSELAADGVLDDPRMRGYQWIHPTKAEIDAWGERPWEWNHGETTTIVIGCAVRDCIGHPDTVAFRPLRFPHQNLETGAIESRYMTPEHFERVVEWKWMFSNNVWYEHGGFQDVDHEDSRELWCPAAWPDVELSVDELEKNIDKSLLIPPDAGAKAVAEYDAAITKYSPDMRDLVGRIGALETRQASLDTMVPLVTQLGERLAKLEGERVADAAAEWVESQAGDVRIGQFVKLSPPGREWRRVETSGLYVLLMTRDGDSKSLTSQSPVFVKITNAPEPEEAPNPLLDGLVPVRADATHPGQWMMLFNTRDATAWKGQASTSGTHGGRIALIDKCRNERLVKPDAIVYVEPE